MTCPLCGSAMPHRGNTIDECECGSRLEICEDCAYGPKAVSRSRITETTNDWRHVCQHPGLWADEFRARHQAREALAAAVAAKMAIDLGDPERARLTVRQVIATLSRETRIAII